MNLIVGLKKYSVLRLFISMGKITWLYQDLSNLAQIQVCLYNCPFYFNPFLPSGLFDLNSMDQLISI